MAALPSQYTNPLDETVDVGTPAGRQQLQDAMSDIFAILSKHAVTTSDIETALGIGGGKAAGLTALAAPEPIHAFPSRAKLNGVNNEATAWSWGPLGTTEVVDSGGGWTLGGGEPNHGVEAVAAGGPMTSYITWEGATEDTVFTFDLYVGIPARFTGWEDAAIRLRHKFHTVSGGSTGDTQINLVVYDPATGAELHVESRQVTTADADYQWLTVSASDLAKAFSEGDMLHIQVKNDKSNPASDWSNRVRVGEIQVNWR